MDAFGFGTKVRGMVKTLYNDALCCVRIEGGLCAPFPAKRGVRQGDSLSGPLFTISIEPVLELCRVQGADFGMRIQGGANLVLSAYADDITFFISRNEGFETLQQTFRSFSAISGAEINIQKSTGVFAGSWANRQDQPMGASWSNEGGCFLGVFMGPQERFEGRNWSRLAKKIKSVLDRWERFTNITSTHGRSRLVNSLAGSMVTHALTVLNPPDSFLRGLAKAFTNFIWNGHHYLHPNYVFCPREIGGLQCSHPATAAMCLRLKYIQNLFHEQNEDLPFVPLGKYFLEKVTGTPCRNVLSALILREKTNLANVQSTFHASAIRAWKMLSPRILNYPSRREHLAEILLESDVLPHFVVREAALWNSVGVFYVGNLLTEEGNLRGIESFSTEGASTFVKRRLTLDQKHFGADLLKLGQLPAISDDYTDRSTSVKIGDDSAEHKLEYMDAKKS
ncbi:hypothetical protein J437_LFUL016014 [Ladona fulva]|uniref:Reverse transcriptase domain-containing protein n=1 Tax=Ladona fulva TaxID=123851 RepID=A0A8K0KHC7_LADFU|nr:hypothetical protein J437_LFUL016014 [Ladona fulva]